MINLTGLIDNSSKINAIFAQAISLGASDIHITQNKPIRLRINGKMQIATSRELKSVELESLLEHTFNSKTALTQVFQSKALNYAYETSIDGINRRFRVNASTQIQGNNRIIKLVLRVLNDHIPSPSDIGLEGALLERLITMSKEAAVISGTTGSGKSTLLASIIAERIKNNTEHVITLEHPVEYMFGNKGYSAEVGQQSIAEYGGSYQSFNQGLVEAMRQDPDVILVGEIRDILTAKASLEAVETGHALFTTIHAGSVVDIIARLNNILNQHGSRDYYNDIVSSLGVLIYQELIPTANGGRTAVREVLLFDDDLKKELKTYRNDYPSILTERLISTKSRLIDDVIRKHQDKIIDEDILQHTISTFNLTLKGNQNVN